MNRLLSTLFLFGLSLTAAAQVTLRPQVERRSSGDVTVLKVEHTAAHTILTLRFAQPALSPVEQQLYERYPERFTHISTISIDPDSYLSGTLDGVQQQAKFVKANGIPVQPDRQRVGPGDVVSFQVYYERLKPGIASFSLFECQSSNDFQCWNFYGIRATNPRQRTATPPKPATAPPPVARKPAPAPAAPKTIRLTGQVRDARTKEPLAASLAYRKARVRVDSVQTVPSLGVYRTALAAGTYTVTIRARGYQPQRVTLVVPATATDLEKDYLLQPLTPTAPPPVAQTPPAPVPAPAPAIPADTPPLEEAEVGSKLTLKNIFFETSKATLQSASYAELNRLAASMAENPTLRIRLEGHTDQIGDPAKNQTLSVERVVAVKRYLVNKGIAPDRIETKGYGDTRPLTSGRSETDRRQNRRVEVIILQK